MLANTSPLVILLLGIIVGWLLEWLFDLWFFRRNRLEAERRLEAVEAQRVAAESRATAAELRASDLEQQLSQTTAALTVAGAARSAETDVVVVAPVDEPVVQNEEATDLVAAEPVAEGAVAAGADEAEEVAQAEADKDEDAPDAMPVSADAWPPDASPEVVTVVEVVEAEVVADEVIVADEESEDAAQIADSGIAAAPVDAAAWPPAAQEEK